MVSLWLVGCGTSKTHFKNSFWKHLENVWGSSWYNGTSTSHSYHRIGISVVISKKQNVTRYEWKTLKNREEKLRGIEFPLYKSGRYIRSSMRVIHREICKK